MLEDKIPTPLRILQVLPALNSGGVERGTIDLAAFLKDKEHIPFVASQGGALVENLEKKNIINLTLPLASKNPFTIFKTAFALKSLVQKHDIHIIHARSRAPAWSAYIAAKLTNTPFVTTFHGTYNFSSPLKRWYNSVMVRGDAVIAISTFIKDHILNNYASYTSPEKITLINRGTDVSIFNKTAVCETQRQSLRKSWHVKKTDRLVLIPGRLTRWKGQLVVLEALRILLQKPQKNLVFIFIGSDQGRYTYTQELKAYVQAHNLKHNVRFVDHVDDMPAAYSLGDLVVHASTDPEAFGRVIIEAQAMEVPVIASNIGAPAQTILEGKTGWLHRAGDATDLALKIQHALSSNTSTLTKKALTEVKNQYNDRILFEKTLALYRALLTEKI